MVREVTSNWFTFYSNVVIITISPLNVFRNTFHNEQERRQWRQEFVLCLMSFN